MKWYNNEYFICDEQKFLNIDYIYAYLSEKSYWAENIPREIVKRSIAGSFCFAVYDTEKHVGFARVIADRPTFGYLADVLIDENYRGRGLGKWLVEIIMMYPKLLGMRGWMLTTKDAYSLYAKFGFRLVENSQKIMRKTGFDAHTKSFDS
jgi:N-acetylglutamate synthase-like GNAT family acetyltransferase